MERPIPNQRIAGNRGGPYWRNGDKPQEGTRRTGSSS
jgi:hypothetical protein